MTDVRNRTIGELVTGTTTLPDWALSLTPRKLAFVQEYLVDFNGRKAAERAQLSETKAGQGSVAKGLLRDPEVMSAIAAAMANSHQERLAMRQRIIEELSAMAFYDIGDHVQVCSNTIVLTDTADLTDDQRRAVKRYKETTGEKSNSLEVEFHDKVKALDLLAKINGDVQQPGGTSVTFNNQTTTNEKVLVLTPDELAAAGKGPKAARPLQVTFPKPPAEE